LERIVGKIEGKEEGEREEKGRVLLRGTVLGFSPLDTSDSFSWHLFCKLDIHSLYIQ